MTRDRDVAPNLGRVAVVAVAPAVLCIALVAHPFIAGRLPNEASIAEKVMAGTSMWGVIHLGAVVGSALIIMAFLAVRSYLHEAGEDRRSAAGVPFVVFGSTLFAVLPGMEFVPLAVAKTGGTTAEIAAAQNSLVNWFLAVLVTGAVTFAVGALLFAAAVSEAGVAGRGLTRVVIGALLVMAVSRFIPLSAAQFYLQSAAALLALWPLAFLMWTKPVPQSRPRAVASAA